MNFDQRVRHLVTRFEDAEIDGLLVTTPVNVRYLSGFSGTNGQMLITRGSALFFTDPRYREQARQVVEGAEVVIYSDRLTDVLPDRVASMARVGFEAATVSVAQHRDLLPKTGGAELVATTGLVEDLRRHKDEDELRLIREAVRIADETFSAIAEDLHPGVTEREVAWEIESTLRRLGAEASSFGPIVGSGDLSAHIHHAPGGRVLEPGDLVLLDFGARVDGYCSDLTRTVSLGPADQAAHDVYALVLAAQEAAIDAARAGRPCREVDAKARSVIEKAGHAENFGHGLGHGVGLDIHEAPRLHPSSEDVLRERDVVTIEPGVYLPGAFGVRIEDCAVVTSGGVEALSKAPKSELVEL